MAQDTKDYILQKSFETFLVKGYDSTSMTILQHEFKMSRGAMYRYFTGKDELFCAVVDKYFWGLVDFIRPRYEKSSTILEFIDIKIRTLEDLVKFLNRIEGIETVFLNYTAFIIQAAKHYPKFIEKWKSYLDNDLRQWESAIQNSINKEEVRQEVDVKIMAKVFAKAIDVSDSSTTIKNFASAAKQTKKMLTYIYSLIKV